MSTIEHEITRVAIAFKVHTWQAYQDEGEQPEYRGFDVDGNEINWTIHLSGHMAGELRWVSIKTKNKNDAVGYFDNFYETYAGLLADFSRGNRCASCELALRGLYRLGMNLEDFSFDPEERDFSELSAHEKLELRLSMPREFWPDKWVKEEAERLAPLLL